MSEELPPADTPPATEPTAPAAKPTRGAKRIQQLSSDLSAAHERIKLLEADSVTVERDTLREAHAALEAKLERMHADHTTAQAQWRTSETMLRRGLVDEEGQAVALALYARLPEEGRPELGGWFDSMVTDDGDTTPAALRPYLAATTAPSSAPSAPPLAGKQPAGSPGTLSAIPASVRAAAARGSKEAQETIRAYLAGRR